MVIIPFLVLQVVIFAGLVLVFRRLMSRHMTSTTTHLQGLSQDYLERQEELKRRLEEGDRHYQEQLAMAKAEIDRMRTKAMEDADATRRQAVAQAREESEHIVQQAKESREAMKRELEAGMEHRVVKRACELIQATLPQGLCQATHAQWLDELLQEGLTALDHLETMEQVREARVVSAFPLSSTQRAQLHKQLQTALGFPVTIQEAVDPDLVAGLTITMGHLVVDGSLASKLQKAARHAYSASV